MFIQDKRDSHGLVDTIIDFLADFLVFDGSLHGAIDKLIVQ